MANRTIEVGGIWADGAPDVPGGGTPPTPLVTYAKSDLSLAEIVAAWPYTKIVDSATHNELLRRLTTLMIDLEQGGVLSYSALTDYPVSGLAKGSDGVTYVTQIINGPTTSVVDPVGDVTRTWTVWGGIVTIEKFGGVGDGITPDTAAFLAYKAYNAITPATLYIPAGNYPCDEVVWDDTFSAYGDGVGVTIIQPIQSTGLICWEMNASGSSIKRMSFERLEADRNKGTAVQTNAYHITQEDIEFKFNAIGHHGATDHFYMNLVRVAHTSDNKMLVDAASNNANNYENCVWLSGLESHRDTVNVYSSCDMSTNLGQATKPFQFVDPILITFDGLYVEYIGAGTGPHDTIEFREDTATGDKRSIVINGIFGKGVAGEVDNLFTCDAVAVVVEGGYVKDITNVADTANGGSCVIRNVELKTGVNALAAGASGAFHIANSMRLGGDSATPIADSVLQSNYNQSGYELSGVGLAVGTPVAVTGKDADGGYTKHQELYTGTTLAGSVGIDGNKNLQLEALVALGRIVLNATSQVDFRAAGAVKGTIDDTTTTGETALLVWDVDNATLERVSVGAAGSGGTGYKVLRIPN